MPIVVKFKHHDDAICYTLDSCYLHVISFHLDGREFNFVQCLGEGGNGVASLYRHAMTNQMLVLKTPRRLIELKVDGITQTQLFEKYDKELQLMKTAYPKAGFYCLHFHCVPNIFQPESNIFSYVMCMPFFPGSILATAFGLARSEIELLLVILATAKELDRIHREHHIIHGDVKHNNILIDNQKNVKFIDFGCSYTLEEPMPSFNYVFSDPDKNYFPPERYLKRGELAARPDPEQDVFSFASMLRFSFLNHSKWSTVDGIDRETRDFYPRFIFDFCENGVSVHPKYRPTLANLINSIQARLELYEQETFRFNFRWTPTSFCLIVNNQVYDQPTRIINASRCLIKEFNTSQGQVCVKFRSNYEMSIYDFNGLCSMHKIYPVVHNSIYQVHSLLKHPLYTPNQPYSFMEIKATFPGVTLDEFMLRPQMEVEIVKICLAICIEAQRIHDLPQGYSHGNIYGAKIYIHETSAAEPLKAYFDEFNWGYRNDAVNATTAKSPATLHWPPERREKQILRPHMNQDIYSLALVLNSPKILTQAKNSEKLIREFTTPALNNVPSLRPENLRKFILQLKERLEALKPCEMLNSGNKWLSGPLRPYCGSFFTPGNRDRRDEEKEYPCSAATVRCG